MTPSARSSHETLRRLSEGLLRSAGHNRFRGNLLQVCHPGIARPGSGFPNREGPAIGLSICLSQGMQCPGEPQIHCDSARLPFQDGAFGIVILYHVIGDGEEPELAEAARVLGRNGVLLVLGLNRFGWRYRTRQEGKLLPGLAPLKLRASLDRLDMAVNGFAGAGLAGRERPASMSAGLLGLACPLADVVLLQAQHRSGPGVVPLRFRKTRSPVVQSAAMRG